MKSLKFAFIQSGSCVFGVGYTEQQAIADARKSLESPTGIQGGMTLREVRELVSADHVDGGFRVISSDDKEFESYMKNQGGFVKRGRNWYNK